MNAVEVSRGSRIKRFLREVRAELRKVAWPTRKELITYTVVVIVAVAAVGIYITLADLVIAKLLGLLGAFGR